MAKPFLKSGLFYVRRRVPNDLVAVMGRTHYLKSLETGTPAEAAKRFPAANAGVDLHFEQIRTSTGSWPGSAAIRADLINLAIERLRGEASETQRRMVRFVLRMSEKTHLPTDDSPVAAIAAVAPAARSRLLTGLFDDLSSYLPSGPLPVPVRKEVLQRLEARLPDLLAAWGTGFVTSKQESRKRTPPMIDRDPDVTLNPLRDAWSKATKPCKSALDDAKSAGNSDCGAFEA